MKSGKAGNTLLSELFGDLQEMNYFSARKYMRQEQAARMGRASQKAQALRRMAEADYDPIPVRSGLPTR